MRLLSVRPGATVLLLVVTLLIARASLSNLHTTAAAQGTVPTATATPDPTVLPTAPSDVHDAPDQLGGLFSQIEGDPPPSSDVETLASRLVGIDFGQLANAIESPVGPKDPVTGIPQTPHKLVLNLFADVVLTGIVEHVEPTASGHALWGGLEGVELGTMTLVVNGSVVVGTVRTPDAVYTIRTAAAGAYVVRQIDESSLPPLGEPLRGSIPEPDSPPPVRPQVRGPDAPDGTSTPTSTPTPVPTVATSPSKPAPDEAMASGLFSEVEGDPPPSPGVDTLASRLVEIDFGQLSQVTKSPVGPKDPVTGKPTEPQALVLNLFDDVVLTGIVEHVEPTSSGHSLWGRLDGVGLGTFTLVVNGRVVIGTVRTPDAVYTIRTAGDGTYVIRQIDESSLPPLGEPLEPPLSPRDVPVSPRDAPAEADDVPSDDGSEIDVMVVYTPLAKHREGGRAAIEALIDLFVAETNQAYAISGVIHRINLMLREEVDYTEDGGSSLDLRRLRIGSDGYMDDVHERRDMYGADLVHILVGRSDVCGRAHLNRGESPAEDEASGFGLTLSYCGGLVFAHELGHNMGLLHDRYELGVPRTGSHYGYVNQRMFEPGAPESARWRTIMAYGIQCWDVAEYDCERIGSFSNPENSYNGDPMGVPADHPSTGVDGPADAVKTLNERREITANFRRSSASPTPRVHLTLSPYWLAEDGGVSTVTATLHRPSSADTTVTISASPSDAVTLSGSRTLTIPAGRTVSVASVTITGVDNGDQTDDVSVTVSATAANTSSLGVVDPEPVALVIADDETTPVVTLSLSPSEIAEHEGWTFVTAMLDSRSSADTIVSVSAEPAELIEQREENTLTIPAGQTENIGFGLRLQAVDNDELAEATQTVTVSGTSENAQGVAGPENVTLTIIDDEAPFFADDSIAYTFTTGIAGSRFLPEAEFGNGKLTYSLSPAPSNDVIFTPGPPARIGVSATSVAADTTSYTLTATDADGDTDTMTISITVRKGVCPNSAAVSGYSDPGIVHDCEALLASRDTLSVDQSLNWDEDLPIDEWKGIRIAAGRVVGLRMSSEGIVGTIPSELGSLANLTLLYLYDNQLTGEIPPELGGLSNLRDLGLWDNQLTGEIPPELGGLSNLRDLSLSGNQLTGEIPPELGGLSNLTWLSLYRNQLTGEIPPELGRLSNLTYLDLSRNQLTGEIPAELGGLSNLTGLVLSGNQLTGEIPKELGSLANLTELWLRNNQLTGGIPKELGNLSNLQALYLGGNLLTGCVPDGLRDVPNNDIVKLGLPFCSEQACVSGGAVVDATNEGLVSDCGMLLAARDTLAGTAALNWSADTPIADWTGVALGEASGRVTEILLGGMGLNGRIPKELGSLANLQSLDLSDNKLTGTIPTELGSLANLQELYLGGNLLTGCVPDGLRDVPNNDFVKLGLPFCSEHPCVSGGAVVDATNEGLVSDCGMLLAARDTLAGTASLNWSADTPIADWTGVALGEASGRVTEILLVGMGLTGRIPPELGGLSNLTYLILESNQLTGEIPPELGSLANLQGLYLSDNQLTGEIPPELGGLSNLTDLVLADNQVTGEIPPELGGLSNLTQLALWFNELTGEIPPELGGLSNLTYLVLEFNQLTGEIPPELGGLSNLEWLYLNDNQLTGEIPPELGRLSNLERLYLGGNLLTGCVPDGLRDVPNNDIVRLGLPFCSEHPCVSGGAVVDATNEGLVSDCGMLLAARDTLAGTASLNWSADTPITEWNGVVLGGTHGRVTILKLGALGLNGRIPKELGSLANLTRLSLWGNQLTGEIPPELGRLSNLTQLILHGNQLTGEIPPELGGLSNLTLLWLYGNGLTGEIPTELGGLSNLTDLFLHGNQLTGEIPPELGGLSNLTYLDLSRNQLTGEIPPELGGLSNLTYLSLSGNQLTGEIPPELGGLSNLTLLSLSGNQLTGEIPPELGGLSNLTYLDLSRNQLTGEIPTELGGLSNLTYLSLSGNQLTGEIPPELGGLSNLTYLSLSGNQLTGEIPPELGGLSNLTRLFLSRNQLTGEIPPELGGLANLQRLYLRGNLLTGCVPAGLRDVPNNDLDQLGLPFCPLSLPEAPTIGSVTSEMDSLTISWTPPLSDGGSDITAYDLRHIETDDDEAVGSNWTVAEDVWTTGSGALEYTLTGLTVGTEYDIQVRAVNAVGDGPWSVTNTATLTTASVCLSGVAVPDPTSNPGLVAVCKSLLTLLDTLVEGTVLNWSADIPISEWDGIEEDSLEGTPPQVVRLYLGGLGLDGAVPSELSGLTELKELYLQDNDLSGPVPVELGELSSLTHLHLQNNDLTGSIPAELGDLTVLRELRLDSNDLTGQLPPELGKLTRATRLWVADNDLSGPIPAELGSMANLDWLNLGRNNFSGQIPAELGNLSRLRRLYIYENDLSGPIPGSLGNLSRLTYIVAQANDLSGEIPPELGNLSNLVWMGLYDNDLTGEIPAELGSLAKLQRLYLTNNELYGPIPEELGNLSALTNLFLSFNYLSGQIPHSLDNLDKLSRLRLAGNRFTGCLPTGLAAVRNSDTDQLGLETCADPAVGTEYGVQEKTASGAVAPKQAATGVCATGGAVPDAANNPGLVSDCEALLAARDTLARTGSLNRSADTPITKWDGITVRGTPMFRNLAFAMRCVQCGHERDVPRPLDYPKLMSIPITVGRLKSGYPARTAGQRATETTG